MTSARLFLLHRLLLVVAAFAVALAATQPISPGRLPARLVAGTAAPAQFRPLAVPVRILDTRLQYNVPNLGYSTPFGEGAMRAVQVTSMGGGLPSSGITAVVMNVTVTNGSSASYLKIYPSGAPAPNTSFLNWGPDQVKPNLVQVEVGPDGLIDVVNQLGTVDVIMARVRLLHDRRRHLGALQPAGADQNLRHPASVWTHSSRRARKPHRTG